MSVDPPGPWWHNLELIFQLVVVELVFILSLLSCFQRSSYTSFTTFFYKRLIFSIFLSFFKSLASTIWEGKQFIHSMNRKIASPFLSTHTITGGDNHYVHRSPASIPPKFPTLFCCYSTRLSDTTFLFSLIFIVALN